MSASATSTVPSGIPSAHGHAQPTSFLALTLGSVGVVYGDIGTSPLYALKESLAAATGHAGAGSLTREMVIGVVSLILWALILIVTIKYVVIVLRADNHGEGGTLSLVTLAQRALGHGAGVTIILGMAGAALFYGDVVITPAISVLSAVEGLKLVTPAFTPYVVPLSLAILVCLFAVQRFGTAGVAAFFGPVTAFWFVVMAFGGILHLSDDWGILAAFDPSHGLAFVMSHGTAGLLALGAVFLAVTGAEALYADLGHFGRSPIRTAWLALVFPSLALNYLGQGALLLNSPESLENPFFLLYPAWALLPMVLLATVATVIASQAVITGAFSISQQAIHLGLLPRFRVLRTSETEKGQVYIPFVNWSLLGAVLLLVVLFGSSSSLAAAYGLAVTGDMVITSCLLLIVAWKFWGWSLPVVIAVIAPFLAVELVFLGANALKIPHGGWFPLVVGGALFTLMWTWRKGVTVLAELTHRGRPQLADFISDCEGRDLSRAPGTAVFFTGDARDVPAALLNNLKHNGVLHDRNVVLTVVIEDVPRLPDDGRVTLEELSERFSRATVRFGFMEVPDVPKALAAAGWDVERVSFFLSRRSLRASARIGLPLWQDYLFIPMARAASDVSDQFCIPEDRAIEVGSRLTI